MQQFQVDQKNRDIVLAIPDALCIRIAGDGLDLRVVAVVALVEFVNIDIKTVQKRLKRTPVFI